MFISCELILRTPQPDSCLFRVRLFAGFRQGELGLRPTGGYSREISFVIIRRLGVGVEGNENSL